MEKIKIVNLKCEGCANTIIKALTKEGYSDVKVINEELTVSFEGDREKALKILSKLGYPEQGSKEAESLFKKAKSYVSCAVGKTNI